MKPTQLIISYQNVTRLKIVSLLVFSGLNKLNIVGVRNAWIYLFFAINHTQMNKIEKIVY